MQPLGLFRWQLLKSLIPAHDTRLASDSDDAVRTRVLYPLSLGGLLAGMHVSMRLCVKLGICHSHRHGRCDSVWLRPCHAQPLGAGTDTSREERNFTFPAAAQRRYRAPLLPESRKSKEGERWRLPVCACVQGRAPW